MSEIVLTAEECAEVVRGLNADGFDRLIPTETYAAVERIVAARVEGVARLHHRRSHRAGDFVAFGQTEFPDLCDHCRRAWPCGTAQVLAEGGSTQETPRRLSAPTEAARGTCPDHPTIPRVECVCPYECDHPGITHGQFSYTGVCPKCEKCKFIGHGPLCADCHLEGNE